MSACTMLMQPDYCIPCILKMSVEIIRGVTTDEKQVRRFMSDVLKMEALRWEKSDVLASEVTRDVWHQMQRFSSIADPLKAMKSEQNSKALNVYPFIKEMLHESNDPILEAVKFAIAGNSIDALLDAKRGIDGKILNLLSNINKDDVEALKVRLGKARHVLYFTDNCGEIVFDKLFVETICAVYRCEIRVVTRRAPILNDATLDDALSIGLGKTIAVTDNGIDESLPGTILEKASEEVRTMVERSDLIISKGGANYETLTEERGIEGKTTYLFQAKCIPYCRAHNVPPGALIVYNS